MSLVLSLVIEDKIIYEWIFLDIFFHLNISKSL